MNQSISTEVLRCIKNEDVATLRKLSETVWDIYAIVCHGNPALHLAVRFQMDKVADWLVSRYHEDGKQGHEHFKTVLKIIAGRMACHTGFYDQSQWEPILKKCLHGMDAQVLTKELLNYNIQKCKWILEAVLDAGANIHIQDERHNNLLHLAADPACLLIFLQKGVDVNHRNDRGFTPLARICWPHAHSGFVPLESEPWIAMLLTFGADPNLPDIPEFNANHRRCLQKINNQLLHYSLDPACFLILLERGTDVNQQSVAGFTPLQRIFRWYPYMGGVPRKFKRIIAMLLIFGADPHIPDTPEFRPGHRQVLQTIQQQIRDAYGRVEERKVAFSMQLHPRLGSGVAHVLPKEIVQQCLNPTENSMRHLVLWELGFLDQ